MESTSKGARKGTAGLVPPAAPERERVKTEITAEETAGDETTATLH